MNIKEALLYQAVTGGSGGGGGAGSDTTAIHKNLAGELASITEKTVLVGDDILMIEDSEDVSNKKKIKLSSISSDVTALHKNVAGEFDAMTVKSTLVDTDLLVIEDSADSNNKKKTTIADIKTSAPVQSVNGETGVVVLTQDDVGNGTTYVRTQNDYTDTEKSKLAGIEANATIDQTGAEIKVAYEAEANTNAFTDAEQTKVSNLSGTNTGDQTISDATITTTDITTNNVSTTKHGFAPKGDGSATSYLDGTGSYSTPTGAGNVSTSGTPVDNDFAKFVNGTDIEGRSYTEVKTDLSLNNVDNTADSAKPISTLQQTALDAKVSTTGNETIGGIKTFSENIVGALTGNASTATELETARTIAGTSFDGTTNIDISHTGLTDKGTNTHSQIDTFISSKASANGLASLGSDGKVPNSQIPSLAITEYLGNFADTTVALANAGVQSSERGDWFTVDTDGGRSYIVISDDPVDTGDIKKLSTPTDSVLSVNGETGTVTLDADDISDTSTVKKFINTLNQTFEGVKTFTSTLNIDNPDVEGVAAIFEKSGNLATCEFRETTDTGYAAFDFFNNGTKRGTICSSGASSGFLPGAFWISTSLSNPMHFAIDSVPKLTIATDGNVGIGTTTPTEKLDVVGSINASTSYKLGGADINTSGTLTNVAYLNKFNTYSNSQKFDKRIIMGILSSDTGYDNPIPTIDTNLMLYYNSDINWSGITSDVDGRMVITQGKNTTDSEIIFKTYGNNDTYSMLLDYYGNLDVAGEVTPNSIDISISGSSYVDANAHDYGGGDLAGRVQVKDMSGNAKVTIDGLGNVDVNSAFKYRGTDINTAGTLTNVAYLNQANTFTAIQSITRELNCDSVTASNIKLSQLSEDGVGYISPGEEYEITSRLLGSPSDISVNNSASYQMKDYIYASRFGFEYRIASIKKGGTYSDRFKLSLNTGNLDITGGITASSYRNVTGDSLWLDSMADINVTVKSTGVSQDATLRLYATDTNSDNTSLVDLVATSVGVLESNFEIYVRDGGSPKKVMTVDTDGNLDITGGITATTGSFSSNVGIGTTTPNAELEVSGTSTQIRISDSDATTTTEATGYLDFWQGDTTSLGYIGYASTVNTDMSIRNQQAGKLKLYTSNLERLTIVSEGNVGIGTSTPVHSLQVKNALGLDSDTSKSLIRNNNFWNVSQTERMTAGYASSIRMNISSGGIKFSVSDTGATGVPVTLTDAMVIDHNGSVGIDTTNPIEKLDIDGKASSSFMRMCNDNTGRLDNEGLYIGVAGTTGEGYIGTRHNKPLHFRTNQTDALFIDINQNVGMNTTTPQAKLDVNGYIKSKQSNVWAYVSTSSATTVTTASTYYPIAGTFVNDMTDFSGATVITPGIKYDGTLTRNFKVTIQGQVEADSANITITLGIKKNGTLVSGSTISTLCRVAGEPYHIGSVIMIELEEDDEIQLVTTADSNTTDVTYENLQTLIEPISR